MDTKHDLIVEHDVANVANDHGQLSKLALSSEKAMARLKLKVAADRGYFSGPQIRACDPNDISASVPTLLFSASRKKGLFTKADLVYVAKDDAYRLRQALTMLRTKSLIDAMRA